MLAPVGTWPAVPVFQAKGQRLNGDIAICCGGGKGKEG